jgi:hypothetical protein
VSGPVNNRLEAWLAAQLPEIGEVRIEGLSTVDFGHSAQMLESTIVGRTARGEYREPVVVRLRPPAPGLLEPYDMRRQFDILRALEIHDRQWYAAFQAFKMAVIQLVGTMLFDRGHSDDIRYADMAMGVQWLTQLGLQTLGIFEEIDPGPVAPRPGRVQEVPQRA